MTITAPRRPAVTLVEVLIAIFLMGIGLMAILSLFPLGAAQMAQALKDQRCAEAATNGSALGRVIWKQVCDEDASAGAMKFQAEYADKTLRPQSSQPFVMAMDDPSYQPPDVPVPDFDANTPTVDDPNLPTGSTTYRKAMPTVTRVAPTGP